MGINGVGGEAGVSGERLGKGTVGKTEQARTYEVWRYNMLQTARFHQKAVPQGKHVKNG